MADRVLVCKDCKAEFIFTEGEQAFYKEKGFNNDPQRCPECRKANKQQKNNGNGGGYGRSNSGYGRSEQRGFNNHR